MREIAETLLKKQQELLDMRKLPKLRMQAQDHFIAEFMHDPKQFLCPFVTVDETWINWYTSETKVQLKQ